jgi:hypothetical protein
MTATVVGVDLDPMSPAVASQRADAGIQVDGSWRAAFPPAMVRPATGVEPMIVDMSQPARSEGCGFDPGPPWESRLPLTYAWELFARDAKAQVFCDPVAGRRGQVPVGRCLARAVHQIIAHTLDEAPVLTAVVVPNAIQEEGQDLLLREAMQQRTKTELVWRPIAAAMPWIEEFQEQLATPTVPLGRSCGRLLHLHLGLDAFEAAVLELVPYQDRSRGRRWLLPGRRQPETADVLQSIAIHVVEEIVNRVLLPAQGTSHAPQVWHALWVTSLLHQAFHLRTAEPFTPLPPWVSPILLEQLHEQVRERLPGPWPVEPRWLPALRSQAVSSNLDSWVQHVRGQCHGRPLGMVVTGPLAGLPGNSGLSLAHDLASRFGVDALRLRIEGMHGARLLARGACIYANRRRQDLPVYLDTLPRVTTLVMIGDDPEWVNLLEMQEPWVPGGRTWKYIPERVRFHVPRDESHLRLVVHREGSGLCKNVDAEFERSTDKECPVTLSIEMKPGQGHPRVEVVPDDRDLFPGRALYLDWLTAKDGGSQTEEEERIERSFPPPEPRGFSKFCWYETTFRKVDVGERSLAFLNSKLAAVKRVDEQLFAAVTSDCTIDVPDLEKQLLQAFLHKVDERLARAAVGERGTSSGAVDERSKLIRILGSVSANTENLLRNMRAALSKHLALPSVIARAVLWACGNCLRHEADLVLFFACFDKNQPDYAAAEAMARILMYRRNALADVASSKVGAWIHKLLPLLGTEPPRDRAKWEQKRAAMAIAYLLRRRAHDGAFLRPGSSSHAAVKAAVSRVTRDPKRGDSQGVRDTLSAFRRVLDYIDKRGRGRLVALMLDDGEDSSEK